MLRRSAFLTLALAAMLVVAGCGPDNGDNNDNESGTTTPTPTRTQTPAPITPTVTPTAGGPVTVTPTPTPGGPETPTPTPTTSVGNCSPQMTLQLTTIEGSTPQTQSDLDTGFSGLAHNQGVQSDAQVTVNLDCVGNDCVVTGALTGKPLGSPLPLSAAGTATCVLNTFNQDVTGTYDCATGCGESAVHLNSAVFQRSNIEKPCPVCAGDATPNDGIAGGTCDSDATTPGAPCDVQGISTVGLGATSNACVPKGSPIANLQIDIVPLTTGTVTLTASSDCLNPAFPSGSCYCPSQINANSCDDGECGSDERCPAGPTDGRCDGIEFRRNCTLGTGTKDCEDTFPGTGTCVAEVRPCFGPTITRTGQCGLDEGTLVGAFCVAKTIPAIDTVVGLPGPGTVSLRGRSVRAPR